MWATWREWCVRDSGLRLMEALRLRVQDVDIKARQLTVRSGKGDKDRVTVLPASLVEPVQQHLQAVRQIHRPDLAAGGGEGDAADGTGKEVPECGSKMVLAVGVSPGSPLA
jgi:integrase